MKQHITQKEWDNLSKNAKMTLIAFANKIDEHGPYPCEFMNIGHMVAFLGDKFQMIDTDYSEGRRLWCVKLDDENPLDPEIFVEEELCNALRRAVEYKIQRNY